MRKIMIRAWEIYRTLEGNHIAKLSMALAEAWKEAKSKTTKRSLYVREWLFQKIAREHGAPCVWTAHVDIIFAETEKAYKVMMGVVDYCVITWIPKSQCDWIEEEVGTETYVADSWKQALDMKRDLRMSFC